MVDNFYNSPVLIFDLSVKNKTDIYHENKYPVNWRVKNWKLEKQLFFRERKCKKDKKDISLISIIPSMVDVETRKGTIKKSQFVLDYNHIIDRRDQRLFSRVVLRKRGKKIL